MQSSLSPKHQLLQYHIQYLNCIKQQKDNVMSKGDEVIVLINSTCTISQFIKMCNEQISYCDKKYIIMIYLYRAQCLMLFIFGTVFVVSYGLHQYILGYIFFTVEILLFISFCIPIITRCAENFADAYIVFRFLESEAKLYDETENISVSLYHRYQVAYCKVHSLITSTSYMGIVKNARDIP